MASEIDALITNHAASDPYDYRDYNRVGAAVAYVASVLNGVCGFNIAVTAKRDWQPNDVFTQSDADRYISDIKICRSAFAQMQSTPQAPDAMRLDVQTANDIEKILEDLDFMISNMRATYNCGWFLGMSDIGLYVKG